MRVTLRAALPAALLLFLAAHLSADEGMWTLDNPPAKLLKERYGFTPTQEWLDHVRLSSVRFNDGGSGSFVSKPGLGVTNHHVGLGCIQKISTAEKDYVASGYVARTAAEEVPCPDLELNVLVSMEDVSTRGLSAIKPEPSDKDAREQRKAATAKIEKACSDETKLRCDVVMLYDGSEFQLYRYRKYTDVRLVFAPEQTIAFYGGDPDNFTFPRYDLDVAIFRAWEDGKPVAPAHYLKWSENGPRENELLFVFGHPGSTGRLSSLAEVEVARDIRNPNVLRLLARRRALLQEYSRRSPESARRAKAALFGVENSQKAIGGYQAGLLDPAVTKKKAADEAAFKAAIAKDPEMAKSDGNPWAPIAEAYRKAAPRIHEMQLVGFGGSRFLGIAGQIDRK